MGQPYPPSPYQGPPFVPPGPGGYAQPPRNGVATAGFVTALVGAVLSLVPIFGLVAWVVSPVGLVLSIVGLTAAGKRRGIGKSLAIAGIVLGAVGLVICILWATVFGAVLRSVPPPEPPAVVDRAGGPVTLEVTAEAPLVSIQHTTGTGATTAADERPPFRLTIPVPPAGPVTVRASGVLGEDSSTGRMTCTITQAGRTVVTRSGSEVVTCTAR